MVLIKSICGRKMANLITGLQQPEEGNSTTLDSISSTSEKEDLLNHEEKILFVLNRCKNFLKSAMNESAVCNVAQVQLR